MSELVVFSAEHVCRLTGLSMHQLRYWDEEGFFVPQYADENRRQPFSRIYSFHDVVGLRTLALLRKQYRVPLQELRKVKAWFEERTESAWARLTFYVGGRRVFFDDPETEVRRAGSSPIQTVMPIEMDKIARETNEAANRLRERGPDDIGRIVRNRYLVHNSYVLAGTRIPTSAIWNFHQAGYVVEEIIREYPRLTSRDVQAAIDHERERHLKRAV